MLSVFTKSGDGKWVCIGHCKELRHATLYLDAFKTDWLHEYEVRDSRGDKVDIQKLAMN
jgi:hypothetical protein